MQGKAHNPGFLAIVDDAKSRIQQMNIEQYKQLHAEGVDHVLVDVREESEWHAGRANGAIHLSKGIIERDIEKHVPDRQTKLVLYCGGGFRSALVAENLMRMGYVDAVSLEGGWRAWNEAGLPVTK